MWSDVLAALTLAAIALVVWHHAAFPVLLRLVAARRRPPEPLAAPPVELPRITVVMPAFQEEAGIAEKIRNLSALDYPADRLDVLIGCDGCTDATAAIARATAAEPFCRHLRVDVVEYRVNRGKVAVLNDLVPRARGEILVLSDVSALVSLDALRLAALRFADPTVGVVCAAYALWRAGSPGEAAYWRYQTAIKRSESALGSTLGAHGALYFLRKALFRPLREDTVNDDFVLPARIVAAGHRAVYDPRMVGLELETAPASQDRARRRRIALGNVQQAVRLRGLLHPRFGWTALAFASGKVLRAAMPIVLLGAFVGTAVLAPASRLFAALLVVELAGALGALLAPEHPRSLPGRIAAALRYILAGHLAGAAGIWAWLRAQRPSSWRDSLPVGDFVHPVTRTGKRLFDVLGAFGLLAATAPLFPLIALAIRLDSKGPVFFRQLRVGRTRADRTELFEMIKFRSMRADAEVRTGAVWASQDDPRITATGRFLRRTRLDELPQLWNVLKGEMSLIGPRPERPGIVARLERAIPFYAERLAGVRPGITGLAQVRQGYDATIDDVRRKLEFDHAYALSLASPASWLSSDLRIGVETLATMVLGRGR